MVRATEIKHLKLNSKKRKNNNNNNDNKIITITEKNLGKPQPIFKSNSILESSKASKNLEYKIQRHFKLPKI